MRSADLGVPEGSPEIFSSTDQSLELFRRICLIRAFENNVKIAHDKKLMGRLLIYLSLGQEAVASALSLALPKVDIFAQHRAHDFYLAYNNNPVALIDELLGLSSGCARGMGGSASIHSPRKECPRMFGHDGLMGTQVPIAVGHALGSGHTVLAVMGDASGEEGYVLGAMGEAASKKAPVLFVCIDNNLSILTPVNVRRSWSLADEANAKGMPSIAITDDPWLVMFHARKMSKKLPAFINVHTCRELWHAGTGNDGPPEWNRFHLIREGMQRLGLSDESKEIELAVCAEIDALWDKRLREVFGG